MVLGEGILKSLVKVAREQLTEKVTWNNLRRR